MSSSPKKSTLFSRGDELVGLAEVGVLLELDADLEGGVDLAGAAVVLLRVAGQRAPKDLELKKTTTTKRVLDVI